MRFIADVMLGRLARWMRFLGFDTLYFHDITDSHLLRIARAQNRLILTRDTQLARKKKLQDCLLINANDSFQQLTEVIEKLKLKRFKLLTRCVACNGSLVSISKKEDIKDFIPEFVYLNYNLFMKCIDCGKIYWDGSHPKKFMEKIKDLLKSLSITGTEQTRL